MDGTGHSTLDWAPPALQKTDADKAQEASCRAEFDRMIASNFMAVEGVHPNAEQVKQFNPDADTITFVPPLQGG